MAIIGSNSIGGDSNNYTNTLTHRLIDNATYTYVAAANQEVFQVGFYVGSSYAGDGSGVDVGVYDITGGTASATLVASGNVSLTANQWNIAAITPVALTEGNTYAVACRIVSATNVKTHSAYVGVAVSTSNLTGSSALAASWTDNGNNGDVFSVYAETQTAASGPAVDTVDDPITPGSNAHTVSGFTGTVNAGSFKTGTAEIVFTTANDTTSTIAEPANGANAAEYGVSGDYELTDGTDTALINTTLQSSTGNAVVTLTSGFDTSITSWLYNYGGTPAIGDETYYPSADLTLNSDGTMTGEAGTYTCYFIDLSDTQPLYEEFTVILGESGGGGTGIASAPIASVQILSNTIQSNPI